MKTKLFNALSLAVIMAMLVTSLALADNVQNDVMVIDGDKIVTITAGNTDGATVKYNIQATNGDGFNGCNAADGTAAIVTPQGMPSGVSIDPTSLSFVLCKDGSIVNAQGVVFKASSSTTPGFYPVTVSVSDNGTGTYNTSPAAFTLHVIAPVKTTPTITWANPDNIVYGTALSGTQLNATALVAGTFTYTPTAGTVLNAGAGQTLHVDFTPTDTSLYNNASKDVTINVLKANPGCSISGYAGTYDGSAHGASGSCTGVGTLDLGGSFTDVPGGTAYWTFTGNANYNNDGGNVPIVISQAPVTATAGGGSSVYDDATHSPSACAVTGAYTGDLSCANAPSSVGPDAGTYPISPVVSGTGLSNFAVTEVGGSYEIQKADATCIITGWTGTYDGNAHGATGSCTGVGGVNLSAGLSLGTTFTDYPGGTAYWTFSGGTNYNDQSGSVEIVINRAPVTATAGSGTSTYDGATHSPSACAVTGAYTGDLTCANDPASVGPNAGTYPISPVVNGTGLSNFDVTSVPGSYIINKADATCSVTGWTGYYDGAFHGASGTCTGVGGVDLNAGLSLGDSFKNVPGGTAYWSFSGGTNYNDQNGNVAIVIDPWTFLGFYQPVDMGATVWNTVKGGSTIPFKFEVFAGSLELTDTSVVKSFNTTQVLCSGGTEDTIELVATGGTSLRYDWTSGQFIYNWQTPKKPGFCYKVTFTLQDGSTRSANFKLK